MLIDENNLKIGHISDGVINNIQNWLGMTISNATSQKMLNSKCKAHVRTQKMRENKESRT